MDTNNYEYMADVLSKLPSSVYWKDKNGVYLGANIRAVREAGLNSVEEIIGKTDYDLFTKKQADEFRQNDLQVMATGKELSLEETSYLTNEDGKRLIKLSTKKPLLNKNGNIVGVVGITVDITDRKKSEEELKIAKEKAEAASKAKTYFIQNIEHDIRTPSSGIASLIKTLDDTPDNPQAKMYIHLLAEASDKLLALLNDALESTSALDGGLSVCIKAIEPLTIVDDIVKLQRPAAEIKHLQLTAHHSFNFPTTVLCDERHLSRILLNLVSNAIKFTKQGEVKITLDTVKHDDEKMFLKLTVEDTGIGISKELQATMYDRFIRGTPSNRGLYSGYGLGLSIVKKYVEELGGKISVESEVDKGTTFTCLIPIKLPDESRQSKLKILLVEKESSIAMDLGVLKFHLPQVPIETAIAEQDAIELIKQNNYDLILVGMAWYPKDSCQIIQTIRKTSQLPIIALTAYSKDKVEKDFSEAGASETVNLSMNGEQIPSIIQDLLGEL